MHVCSLSCHPVLVVVKMQITFAALVRCSLVLSLPLAEAKKCTKSRLSELFKTFSCIACMAVETI